MAPPHHKERPSRQWRLGATLVELTIVVAIVGLLAAIAIPKYVDALHKRRVEAAAERLQADLRMARTASIARSHAETVVFDPASESYSIPTQTDIDRPTATYMINLSDSPYCTVIEGIALDGAANNITFDHYGQPNRGGTVTLRAGAYQQTVTIEATSGRATIP